MQRSRTPGGLAIGRAFLSQNNGDSEGLYDDAR
jgi:hypothetical protein